MSHPVNDEILETLYEEVDAEYPIDKIYPNLRDAVVEAEVMRRFEALSM